MSDAMQAETITTTGHNGDEMEAYLAQPRGDGRYGGVVVIHHMPGYDEGSKEIVRRFAANGYIAICPNLYSREGLGRDVEEAAAAARERGGVPDDQLVGDVEGAVRHVKALPTSNGKAGTIGYCSGGRQSLLAACRLPLDAAVDCYGGFVVNAPPEGVPLKVGPIVELVPQLSCPLLGLFGAEDQHPSPEETAALAKALEAAGKTFELHTFDDAGHAFFAVDRTLYRPEAAVEGWKKVFDFFGRTLQ